MSEIRYASALATAAVASLALFASPVLAQEPSPGLSSRGLSSPGLSSPGPSTPPAADLSPLEPATTGGLAALDRALARLSTHRRVLVVGAHPDDEDTRILAYVARGLGGEAAYFSLSRGDGGQNLIGEELGPALGLLRSRELEAARRVDGARQYFSRAYDFGFTRSLDETFARWPREVLVADAVRVVRDFRPQVMVAVFPPDERAGHGQHQASAVIAREAYDRAGLDGAFPALRAIGLGAFSPRAFYRAAWLDPAAATLRLPLAGIEPFSGRSLSQIAMDSRSRHRSQDMGQALLPGAGVLGLVWEAGSGGAANAGDLFAGVDTRLAAIAAPLADPERRRRLEASLARVEELARGARGELSAVDPARVAPRLLEIVGRLEEARRELAAAGDDPAAAGVLRVVAEKRAIALEAATAAAQVMVDATADVETVVPGGRLGVEAVLWNAGPLAVEAVTMATASGAGWSTDDRRELDPRAPERLRGALSVVPTAVSHFSVAVPETAPPTVPYFLERPLQGDLYAWRSDAAAQTRPFGRAPLWVRFAFRLAGVPIELEREVVERHRDQAVGEVRRPLRAVPAFEVLAEPRLVLWRLGARREAEITVDVASNLDAPTSVRVVAELPPGWPPLPAQALDIPEPRGEATVKLVVRPPAGLAPGRYPIRLAAIGPQGRRYEQALHLVDYPHVRPTAYPVAAEVEVSATDVALPALHAVGWVRGPGDRLPELLRALGIAVEVLDGTALRTADLTRFDAIVVGSRAYETEPALAVANPRLLEFARGGRLLLVLYQQYPFVDGGFAPFPLAISRPHDRVTDEASPVRLLDPAHPLFQRPNRLGPADWDGWVQERGLYFAGTWDGAYQPLLALADPGSPPLLGGLLVAPLGAGRYVYTGLAFFRQLPAGVPGALRLFANLLALAEPAPAGAAAPTPSRRR